MASNLRRAWSDEQADRIQVPTAIRFTRQTANGTPQTVARKTERSQAHGVSPQFTLAADGAPTQVGRRLASRSPSQLKRTSSPPLPARCSALPRTCFELRVPASSRWWLVLADPRPLRPEQLLSCWSQARLGLGIGPWPAEDEQF
ncbi:hypothetical protein P154DRAFT_570579 [Amniculicola lignicola CBS 123094]|uniref:Uncharacterized protein n=1 Tax=Amniculicola lignicola CBS 123094 TaxID=1392246 RepID=A0A6A5WYJ8_9PLEO|nr:hypothetical protein P154DRAFT_570579 [Amniculicola lignicola CBS 123094]